MGFYPFIHLIFQHKVPATKTLEQAGDYICERDVPIEALITKMAELMKRDYEYNCRFLLW